MIFNVPIHIEMIRNGLFQYKGIDKPDWSLNAIREYHIHRAQSLADRSGVSKEVKDGLHPLIIKTQTRRPNRGIYQVGRGYAVQRKRGAKAEPDIRIVMDKIEKETGKTKVTSTSGRKYAFADELLISKEDAQAEGNYTPEEYETIFREVYPKWGGWKRWAFKFHVIEVKEK